MHWYVQKMIVSALVALACAAVATTHATALHANEKDILGGAKLKALDEYVNRDDGMFSITNLFVTLPGSGFSAHLYNFTSQKWLTPKDSNIHVWWHILAVVVPDNVDTSLDSSLLFIAGSKNTPSWLPSVDDDKLRWSGVLTVKTRSTAAVLYQIPNAPVQFSNDPWNKPKRTEDSIIAFTWWKFTTASAHERNPEWLLQFPMTKAGIKAMDVMQQVIPQYIGNSPINKISVTGLSKRGWTTWLVGAVEAARPNSRLLSIMPIVLDLANVQEFLHRQIQYYGAWTYALFDYIECNMTVTSDTPEVRELLEHVDMWYYMDRFNGTPSYVITAGGDQFQMPDNHRFFAHKLTSKQSYFYTVKNADHSLDTARDEVYANMASFISSVQGDRAKRAQPDEIPNTHRPHIEWHICPKDGRIFLNTSIPFTSVALIYSDSALGKSAGKMDFRWVTIDGDRVLPWLTENISGGNIIVTSETSVNALVGNPAVGQWRAFTLEVTFPNPYSDIPLLFTAPASIIPVGPLPFPDCSGENCGREMI